MPFRLGMELQLVTHFKKLKQTIKINYEKNI